MKKRPKSRTGPTPEHSHRSLSSTSRHKSPFGFHPDLIIFDVDGVLVDVRGSFHRTTLETVAHFTGKRVTRHQLQHWKNQSGFNDDWKLSTAWVRSLGGEYEFEEVKSKFIELYWGENGRGHVAGEKWLLPRSILRRLAKHAELALFTGRVRRELDHTLDRRHVREFFGRVVTAEDVTRHKPDPEGLYAILKGSDPSRAVYVGDNVDDALAARSAQVPFIGIIPPGTEGRRKRVALLRKSGALAILHDIRDLDAWLRPTRPRRRAKTSVPSKA